MTSKPDHLERTAAEPRDKSLYTVILQHIEQVNDTTRIFHLGIPRDSPPIRFLPGQWLDVYVPGVEKAGGFTITSTPREARLAHPPAGPEDAGERRRREKLEKEKEKEKAAQGKEGPYLELAVQKSPDNPPAAWLWQDAGPSPTVVVDDDDGASRSISSPIIGSELHVRIGGGFVWPPPGINARALRRVVFVAGGVGVNPLVSMLGFLASSSSPAPTSLTTPQPAAPGGDLEVRFLYSTRDPGAARERGAGGEEMRRNARGMLFLERIARVFRQGRVKGRLEVFLTDGGGAGAGAGTTDGEGGKKKKGEGARTSVDGDGDGDGDGDNGILVGGGDEGEAEFTIPFHPRRCTVEDDVAAAVGNPRFAVVYVCGVPAMTDEFVAKLTRREDEGGLGMEPYRVLCEKWW